MKIRNEFQTCIFDFDGVIINSEPLHAAAKQITLDKFQISHPSTLFADFKGRTDRDFFDYISRLSQGRVTAEELGDYKRKEYLKLVDQVSLVPGIEDFLYFCRKRFEKLGVVTSATRSDFSLVTQKYPLQSWFDIIITGDDTAKHKPDPEPYSKAISKLSAAAVETLVIEDSPNGIRSAKSANCMVVAITTSFRSHDLHLAGADMVVTSFSEIEHELKRSNI
jgi:beta-phosphoglucomutase